MHFDTDSFLIGMDTFASITMATQPEHFDGLILTKKDGIVKGIEGGLAIKGKGTFKFNIEDDHGKVHHIKIPNSAYVPGLKYCLLSPQHWAQEVKDKFPLPRGTRMENGNETIIFGGKVNIVKLFLTVQTQILLSFGWLRHPTRIVHLSPMLKPWKHSTIATKRSSYSLVNAIS
jgi:hypothetical protein